MKKVIYKSKRSGLEVTDIEIDGEYTNETRFVFFEAQLTNNELNESDIDLPIDEETKTNPALSMKTRLSLSKVLDFSVFRAGSSVNVQRVTIKFDLSNEKSNNIATMLNEKDNSAARIIPLSEQYNCVFINSTTGRISGDGLEEANYQQGKGIECRSTHATVFAVLLSVNLVSIPSGVKVCVIIRNIAVLHWSYE